jgi:hypothetical protein
MKKTIAVLSVALSTSVFAADSVTLEGSSVDNVNAASQQQFSLIVKKDLIKDVVGDVAFHQTQTDVSNALGTRLETGATFSQSNALVGFYARTAVGQRYSNTKDFSYYSIEPGINAKLGSTGLTAKVGYRYRSAFDSDTNGDQTHTMRYSLNYALTKLDTVGVRYDRVNGDSDQKTIALSYTRSF